MKDAICLFIYIHVCVCTGFSGGLDGKEPACNAGDLGSIPGLGRSPGEGNGYPLQYSCLENPMDRGAWQATVHGVAKSRTRQSNFHFCFLPCVGMHSRLPRWLSGKEPACRCRRCGFEHWAGKIPWRKERKVKSLSCVWLLWPCGL